MHAKLPSMLRINSMQVNDQGMQQEKSLNAISQWDEKFNSTPFFIKKIEDGVKVINIQVKKIFFFMSTYPGGML